MSWLDGDRRAARNRRAQGSLRGSAKSPEERTKVLRRREGASEGVPRPLVSVSPGIMLRQLLPRRAFRRSVSPQGGGRTKKPNSRGGARTRALGCLKCEFDDLHVPCPGAMRHSSCRFAEPGPYQTPVLCTAPALQRTASRSATRCAASGERTPTAP